MIKKNLKRILKSDKHLNNERGSILAVSLLAMVTITLLIIYGSNRSTTETYIASNEKFHRVAFYAADSGTYSTPKLISEALRLRGTPYDEDECEDPDDSTTCSTPNSFGKISYAYDSTNDDDTTKFSLYREIAGYSSDDEKAHGYTNSDGDSYGAKDTNGNWIDFSYSIDDSNKIKNGVNITRLRAVNIAGGGAEFASGTDGSGVGLKGIIYYVDSNGIGPNNSISNIGSQYRYILRTSGGM